MNIVKPLYLAILVSALLTGLSYPTYAVAQSESAIETDSAAITSLNKSMANRFLTLKPHLDAGIVGLTHDGILAFRDAAKIDVSTLLVDMHGAGNPLASSGGESRNIRAAYGDADLYTRWSIRAWQLWQARERELGLRFLYPCGSLRMLGAIKKKLLSDKFDFHCRWNSTLRLLSNLLGTTSSFTPCSAPLQSSFLVCF